MHQQVGRLDGMKVLMVSVFPRHGIPHGGVETSARNLALGLQELGVDVVVVDPRGGTRERESLLTGGMTLESLGIGPVWGRSARARALIASIAAEHQVDIVHGQGVARYLPLDLPNVFTLHGILELEVASEESPARGLVKRATVVREERAARLAASNAIAISAYNRGFLDPSRQRIWDIPNAISPHFFRTPSTDRTQTILYAGSLRGRKRVRELLRAFQQATPNPVWRLAIAGSGLESQYGQQCRADTHSLGIDTQVDFLGALNPQELADHMAKAHALVLPSAAEGAPMVIAEALACGLPVIATDVGAAQEMVQNGATGVLVPPEDVPALGAALSFMMQVDLADGWSDRARKSADRYNYRVVSQATLVAYEEILGASSRATADGK